MFEPGGYNAYLDDARRAYWTWALRHFCGNVAAASEHAGVSVFGAHKILARLNIDAHRFKAMALPDEMLIRRKTLEEVLSDSDLKRRRRERKADRRMRAKRRFNTTSQPQVIAGFCIPRN